jgi:hypothetical protein
MTNAELRNMLGDVGVTQAGFARLIGVTSRAVALWMADERAIPGPVDAYVRILRMLPANLRQIELNRLKEKGTNMRDGIFGIKFRGSNGESVGILIFDDGQVYGTDVAGVRYDGDCVFDETSGIAKVQIKVSFPPKVKAVFGISNEYEWSYDVVAKFNPNLNLGSFAGIETSIGQRIQADYFFLRSLPGTA